MNRAIYTSVLTTLIAIFYSVTVFSEVSDLITADSPRAIYEAGEEANRKGDRKTAFTKFYAAALEREELAYGKLGSMYLYGLGTEKDYLQAYIWFQMSYLTGDKYAQRFRDAASSMMTHEQYDAAVKAAAQQRIRQKLGNVPPKQKSDRI